MGVNGHFTRVCSMSAIPPKADVRRRDRHVRFVPEADMLFLDQLVGAARQRKRDSNTKRLGGLEVDEQLKFCSLLDR
jgi:hypothetical protein